MSDTPQTLEPAASADAPPVSGQTAKPRATRQKLDTALACSMLLARYVRRWMDGKARIDDVSKLAHILQVQARLIDGGDLEQRIEALEEANKRLTPFRRGAA